MANNHCVFCGQFAEIVHEKDALTGEEVMLWKCPTCYGPPWIAK